MLKSDIIKRGEKGGTLVVRPDSGDPPEVVVKVSSAHARIKFEDVNLKTIALRGVSRDSGGRAATHSASGTAFSAPNTKVRVE